MNLGSMMADFISKNKFLIVMLLKLPKNANIISLHIFKETF